MNIYYVLKVHFICKIEVHIAINAQIIIKYDTYRDWLILNETNTFEKYLIAYTLCGRQIHIRACEEATMQLDCDTTVNKLALSISPSVARATTIKITKLCPKTIGHFCLPIQQNE